MTSWKSFSNWPWRSWQYQNLEYLSSNKNGTFAREELDLRSNRTSSAILACLVLSIVANALLAARLVEYPANTPSNIRQHPGLDSFGCGNSVEEAIIAGCTFDPLSVYWLPASCSRAGTEEFLHHASSWSNGSTWRYWTDREGEDEILDLPSRLGDLYYTTESEHMVHCAYMLHRLAAYVHDQAEGLGEIKADDMTLDFNHSKHCISMMLNATKSSPTRDHINSFGKVQLGTC